MTAIRLADESDRAKVEALIAAAYAKWPPRIGCKPGPMLDDYAVLIADRRVWLLEDDGALQGLFVLIPEPDGMLLDNLAVDPRAQGRGFGRRLMDFAEAQAIAAGFRKIRLYTHEKMTENIALYGRAGYVETHRGEEKGLKRVYMTKALAAG